MNPLNPHDPGRPAKAPFLKLLRLLPWSPLGLAFFALGSGPVSAQTPTDFNQGLSLSVAADMSLSWWGRAGHTYFLQFSSDLATWYFTPYIAEGDDDVLTFTGPTPENLEKIFWRTRSIDLVAADPYAADFDQDGVSNADELTNGTDPLNPDSDGDQVPDGIEIAAGTDPTSALDQDSDTLPDDWEWHYFNTLAYGASDDQDGDGLTNADEFAFRLNPAVANTAGWTSLGYDAVGRVETADLPDGRTVTHGVDAEGNIGTVATGN
jgi:hypothetical protein